MLLPCHEQLLNLVTLPASSAKLDCFEAPTGKVDHKSFYPPDLLDSIGLKTIPEINIFKFEECQQETYRLYRYILKMSFYQEHDSLHRL